MSLWEKLRGTTETIFQIALGGPQVKNNAGVLENRNAADSGFVIDRGATPIAANDLATKAYVDAGDVGVTASTLMIRIPIALVTVSSATSLPLGAIVESAKLDITTPYSGGATISLGQAGSVSEFMAVGDNNPQAAGLYIDEQDTAAASLNPLLVTIAGGPAAGAGFAIVKYTITPNA